MRPTTDLDRVIATWLDDGPTAAPSDVVERALADSAHQRQRPLPRTWPRRGAAGFAISPATAVAIAAAVIVLTTAIGINTGVIPVPALDREPQRSSPPSAEPSRLATAELRRYTNVADGYELLLPEVWADSPTLVTRRAGQTVMTFGAGAGAGTRGSPALAITVGLPDGSITPCGGCGRVVVESLDDLEAALTSTPPFYTTGPAEVHADLTLGGVPARSESAGIGNDCLGCPEAYFHVYAVRDGRPYVLAFDYWTVRFESIVLDEDRSVRFSPETLAAILESFAFLDERGNSEPSADASGSTSAADTRFVGPDGTFAITLPSGWHLDVGSDPSALYLSNPGSRLTISIRAGDADGSVRMCDSAAGPWESCPIADAATLDRLDRAIALDGQHSDVWTGPNGHAGELGGEPARTTSIVGGRTDPVTVKYVVAMHEGRAYVVRAVQERSPDTIARLSELLDEFEFLAEGS